MPRRGAAASSLQDRVQLMPKTLVFGDDAGPCLAVARSLGRRGIEVHLTSATLEGAGASSRYVSAVHTLPVYEHGGDRWLERVQDLVAAHSYDLLVPTSDSSLAQTLRHHPDLGARVAIPNVEAAEVFLDKAATRDLAERLGVPVSPGGLLKGGDEAAILEQVRMPAVLKRRFSYRLGEKVQKSKVQIVKSADELKQAIRDTRFELIEEFLPGYCRGVSVLACDGEVLVAHQHRRLRQEHPTGPSSSRISEKCDPVLLGWTTAMVAATNLTGVAMFEYRHSPKTGKTHLLEVNPRFWGSLPLALACGADFPALVNAMLMEGRKPEQTIGTRPGVVKRSLEGEYHALAWSMQEAASFPQYFRSAVRALFFARQLLSKRTFDSWAADDPQPFAVERRVLLANIRRYIANRLPSAVLERATPTA